MSEIPYRVVILTIWDYEQRLLKNMEGFGCKVEAQFQTERTKKGFTHIQCAVKYQRKKPIGILEWKYNLGPCHVKDGNVSEWEEIKKYCMKAKSRVSGTRGFLLTDGSNATYDPEATEFTTDVSTEDDYEEDDQTCKE
jgi:hypothetical protein